MLHSKTNNRIQTIRTTLSLVLVFVFFAISGVQILHTHSHGALPGIDDHTEYAFTTEKCLICDFISHKQPQSTLFLDHAVWQPRTYQIVKFQRKSLADVYSPTPHGFSNKAPPIPIC